MALLTQPETRAQIPYSFRLGMAIADLRMRLIGLQQPIFFVGPTAMSTLEILIVVLILLWLLGAFVWPVGGSLIHLLLVVILIIVVIRLLEGRRRIL
jgi:Family of unknown function (DUF5670)